MNQSKEEQFQDTLETLAQRPETPNPQFVKALESRLQGALTPTPMIPSFFSRFSRRPMIPATVFGVLLIAVGIVVVTRLFSSGPNTTTPEPIFHKLLIQEAQAQEHFALAATSSDALGISVTSRFRLTSKTTVDCDDVAASLAASPDVVFDVQMVSDRECELLPDRPLQSGELYQIALGTTVQTTDGETRHRFQWAYQTKDELAVAGTLPRDRASDVPVTTGIDVTFTTSRVERFADYFSITPKTKGRFEQHGRTWSFVPDERLAAGTLYTVTVEKGVPVNGSDVTLESDVVFRFATPASSSGGYLPPFESAFSAVKPDEAPVIDFGYQAPPGDLTATVYAFSSADELMERFSAVDGIPTWAYGIRETAQVSTDGLRKVGEFPLAVVGNVLRFPSGFDRGYYLVSLPIEKKTFQTPLVVSDLAASLTLTKTNTVIWLYDLKTNEPLGGATVKATADGTRATSDETGIAEFTTPTALIPDDDGTLAQRRSYFLVTANDGRQTLLPAVPQDETRWYFGYGSYGGTTRRANDYWTYLWTDRTLYRPTDTLNLWGVLKHRDTPKTETVTFDVWTWDFLGADGEYVPVATGEATTGEYGTYHASLALQSLAPGYYQLSAKAGGKVIASRSFEVRRFTKPAYQILVTADKNAVVDGDTVQYDIRTQFFDGTPAPLIKLRYASYGEAGSDGTDLTTDEQGRATLTKKLELAADDSRQYPSQQQLVFFPRDAAEGDITATNIIMIYPSAVTFSPTLKQDGDNATVNLTLSALDLAQFTAVDAPWLWSYTANEALNGDPVPNAKIEGTVYEIVTTKTKQGTRYDYLEKEVVDLYTYETHNEKREDFSGTTDSDGRYSRDFRLDGDAHLIDFSARDTQGRRIVRSVYVYKESATSGYGTTNAYTLRDAQNLNPFTPEGSAKRYRIDETTDLRFLKDGEAVANEGSFLFLKLRNGVREYVLSKQSTLPIRFEEADVPNVYYTAVWFRNGVFASPNTYDLPQLRFDETSRQLTVTVTPGQKEYAPGATAKLNVRVRDADDKPARAMVSVSVIDEALAVIEYDNPPVPLTGLYQPVAAGLLQSYTSHSALSMEMGAEGGGGGGGERKNFKDAVYFDEVETNGNGEATVSFTLPDNLTSWRVTSQAVTKDLLAGHVVTALPVTKPIFGLVTLNEEYVVQDQPVVLAAAYGDILQKNQDIEMTLAIASLAMNETRAVKPFTAERFTLPKLAIGDHDVKLTVKRGLASDTHVRRITVLPSRLTRAVSSYRTVETGMTFSATGDARSTLVFSDAGRGRVLATLESLQWSWGKRLDRSVAAIIARDTLKELGGTAFPDIVFSPEQFQQADGGISLLTYGSSELRLSAFAAARADLFDDARLRVFFEQKLSQKDASLEQIGYALLGLANMREPVLADLDAFLALPNVTDEHRLIAALAFEGLDANDRVYALAKPILEKYGETQDPFIRLDLGESNDDKIVHSAEFAILAESLKLDERRGLGEFLGANFPKDTITNLERAIAMRTAVPNLDDAAASFRYRLGDDEQTVDFAKQRTYPLSVTRSELEDLAVLDVTGPVGVVQSSLVPLDSDAEPRDARLRLDRSYGLFGDRGRPIQVGDIVRVTLTPNVAKGVIDQGFLVSDELPSGLVPLSKPWERGIAFDQDQGYAIETDGQRVTFYTSGRRAFHYYARVLTPGIFAAEPAVLQGERSRDIVTYSGAQSLEIR